MLDEIINRIRNYPTAQFVRESVNENRQFAEDLQRDQLNEGVDHQNRPITPGYTLATRIIKRRKGQPADRVTWRDTGRLHSLLRLQSSNDGYEIDSPDPKTPELIAKYGDVLGHNQNSQDLMSMEILSDLQQKTFNYFTR